MKSISGTAVAGSAFGPITQVSYFATRSFIFIPESFLNSGCTESDKPPVDDNSPVLDDDKPPIADDQPPVADDQPPIADN